MSSYSGHRGVIPSAYYVTTALGYTVTCPRCGELHTYTTSGENRCYKTLDPFNVVAPFTSWQYKEARKTSRRHAKEVER